MSAMNLNRTAAIPTSLKTAPVMKWTKANCPVRTGQILCDDQFPIFLTADFEMIFLIFLSKFQGSRCNRLELSTFEHILFIRFHFFCLWLVLHHKYHQLLFNIRHIQKYLRIVSK